jgi:hypothetical protein
MRKVTAGLGHCAAVRVEFPVKSLKMRALRWAAQSHSREGEGVLQFPSNPHSNYRKSGISERKSSESNLFFLLCANTGN